MVRVMLPAERVCKQLACVWWLLSFAGVGRGPGSYTGRQLQGAAAPAGAEPVPAVAESACSCSPPCGCNPPLPPATALHTHTFLPTLLSHHSSSCMRPGARLSAAAGRKEKFPPRPAHLDHEDPAGLQAQAACELHAAVCIAAAVEGLNLQRQQLLLSDPQRQKQVPQHLHARALGVCEDIQGEGK